MQSDGAKDKSPLGTMAKLVQQHVAQEPVGLFTSCLYYLFSLLLFYFMCMQTAKTVKSAKRVLSLPTSRLHATVHLTLFCFCLLSKFFLNTLCVQRPRIGIYNTPYSELRKSKVCWSVILSDNHKVEDTSLCVCVQEVWKEPIEVSEFYPPSLDKVRLKYFSLYVMLLRFEDMI